MRLVTVIYFLIVFKFIYPFFIRYCGFPDIKSIYVNLIFFGLFIYSFLIYPVLEHRSVRPPRVVSKYRIFFFALFVLVVLSGLLNSNNWVTIIKSIIDYYFPYLFLFLIISRIELRKKEERTLLKLCFYLISLQIPVVLFQFFFGGYSSADSISGTIVDKDVGGTGVNGVLGTFLLSVCLSRIVITGVTPGYLVLGLLTLIPSIVGGNRFGLILMPIVVVVMICSVIWVGDAHGVKRILGLAIFMFAFAAVFYGVFDYIVPKYRFSGFLDFDMLKSPEAVLEYDRNKGSQRLLGYVILYKLLFKDWINVLFGLGSNAIIKSEAFDLKVILSVKDYFPVGATDAVTFLMTIGTIGLALAITILVYGIVWVKKYLKIETCPFMTMNAYAFICITAVCLLSLGYTLVWSSQISLTYWVLAGVLMKRYTFIKSNR